MVKTDYKPIHTPVYTQAELDQAVAEARRETWEAATKVVEEILVGNHGMFTVSNWIKDRFETEQRREG